MAAREVQMIVVRYFSTIRHQIPPSARIGRLAEFERPSWLAHCGDKAELSVKVPRQVDRIRVCTEDERVTFLSLVLLWVNVKLLAIHYSRTLDSLPRGAINATEDHIDLILLDELSSFGFRYTICSCTVLEVQIYLSPQQATLCIDVLNHHLGHVCIGDTHERECTRLVGDYAHLDGWTN